MTKERITKVLKENLEHQKVAYDSVYSLDTELTEAVTEAIKLLEQNTVSEEVYTEEYKARKQAEYELWKIKEQQSSENCEYNRGYRDGYDKGNLNGYELRKSEEKKSNDCISKSDVDQNIYDYAESNGLSYANLKNAILDVPPAIPTQTWIPVSERLPEPNRLVVCYITTGTTETYFLALWNDIQKAWEEGIGGYRLLERDLGYEVLAWQPLPKPYEGEKND